MPGAACGSVLLNGDSNPQVATQETSPVCVSMGSGSATQSIQIELYYQQMASAPIPLPVIDPYGFDIVWCFSTGGPCDPNQTAPLEMDPSVLRISP